MAKRNPRNKGLQGNDLIKLKYDYLTSNGIPAKYARKFRKNSWDKIDQAIKLKRGGMLDQVPLPPKQKKIKTKKIQKEISHFLHLYRLPNLIYKIDEVTPTMIPKTRCIII